jgi:DNA-binding HxlR family transcriptional regulator
MVRRSDCPIACTLDLLGDKWTLLVLRDIVILNKSRFEQFLDSPEKIATNILTDRPAQARKSWVNHESSIQQPPFSHDLFSHRKGHEYRSFTG